MSPELPRDKVCVTGTAEKLGVIVDNFIKEAACLRVLVEVRGHKGAVAVLKDRIAKEQDPPKRERFERSLRVLMEFAEDAGAKPGVPGT